MFTEKSLENLKIADKLGVENFYFQEKLHGFLVWVEWQGRRAFLHDGDSPVLFTSIKKINDAIQGVRADLMITTGEIITLESDS